MKEFFRNLMRRYPHFLSLFPGASFILIFAFIPLFWMFLVSFYEAIPGGYMRSTFTLENYWRFLADAFYLRDVLYVTVKLSLLATALAVPLGYMTAHFLVKSRYRGKSWLISLVVAPLWITVVVRLFGWMVILLREGPLNQFLIATRIIAEPIKFMGTELGVLIALTQISVPFAVLPLMGVLENIDPTLEEAAQIFRANRIRTFLAITLPLSIPGIVASSLLVFGINMSSFIIPQVMGGGRVRMIGLMAYKSAMLTGNLPFAAAMGIILLFASLISIALYLLLLKKIFKGVFHSGK